MQWLRPQLRLWWWSAYCPPPSLQFQKITITSQCHSVCFCWTQRERNCHKSVVSHWTILHCYKLNWHCHIAIFLMGCIWQHPSNVQTFILPKWQLYVHAKKNKGESLRQLTLVYYKEVDRCAVVLVLLFGIASKTNVLAAVLKSDIPKQDGDITVIIFPHKLHPFSIYRDIWHRVLWLYHRVTHLKAAGNCQESKIGRSSSGN